MYIKCASLALVSRFLPPPLPNPSWRLVLNCYTPPPSSRPTTATQSAIMVSYNTPKHTTSAKRYGVYFEDAPDFSQFAQEDNMVKTEPQWISDAQRLASGTRASWISENSTAGSSTYCGNSECSIPELSDTARSSPSFDSELESVADEVVLDMYSRSATVEDPKMYFRNSIYDKLNIAVSSYLSSSMIPILTLHYRCSKLTKK